MRLTTEADLATEWQIEPAKLADRRQREKWPHVRITRFDVRYTDEQIAAIVRDHSVGDTKANKTGLTPRSARRAP